MISCRVSVPDSSSISEKRPAVNKPAPAAAKRTPSSALKRNPNMKREMRPELELSVVKKLESLGVRSVGDAMLA